MADMGNGSSSLAGGSPATPAEGPAEPHSDEATHKAVGPTPSHQPGPETADRAEHMPSGTAAGALAAGRGVYIDLSPGTPGEGWPAGSGCPRQPILAPQGLIVAENGPCCTGQVQGQVWDPEGQGGHWAAALACFLIILTGLRVRGNFKKTALLMRGIQESGRGGVVGRDRGPVPQVQWKPLEDLMEGGRTE